MMMSSWTGSFVCAFGVATDISDLTGWEFSTTKPELSTASATALQPSSREGASPTTCGVANRTVDFLAPAFALRELRQELEWKCVRLNEAHAVHSRGLRGHR